MKVIVFDQWEKLVAKFRGIATAAMNEKTQYDLVRLEPKGGRVQLSDGAEKLTGRVWSS